MTSTPDDDHRLSHEVEERLLPHDLERLAHETGMHAMRVPAELVEDELPGKTTTRRVIEAVMSFGIVGVIFVAVLPAVTGAQYDEVWAAFGALQAWELAALLVLWLAVMWTYTGVLTASLPGLTHAQALTMNFAGSAVSNVVPFGGAVGVGATYAMGRSWGFDVPAITRSILVSGFWNVFAKLGIPLAGLVLLTFSGQATASLTLAAVVGVLILSVTVLAAGAILRSDRLAILVGHGAERILSTGSKLVRRSGPTELTDRILSFRHDSIGLIRQRWRSLTVWMIVYTLGQYLLLLGCVRALGATTDELGWVEVFAAFAFGRLLSTIPLTPSGVGFTETGSVAALVAFGAPNDAAAAAVFLFSGFTYLAEIPLGLIGWAVWATNSRWRKPVNGSVSPAG